MVLALSLLCITSVVLVVSLFTYNNYFVAPDGAAAAGGAAATGSITFSNEWAFMGWNEWFELNDGQGNTTTISVMNFGGTSNGVCLNDKYDGGIWDSTSSQYVVSPPECTHGYAVDVGGGPTKTQITERFVSAINSSSIGITASWTVSGTVQLTNDTAGTAGNVSILVYGDLDGSTEVTIAGMSGGDDGGSNPTATAITPVQSSASLVTVTTTIADDDNEVTSLTVEHSTSGTVWTSSTIATVTFAGDEGDGGVTSTGSITDIDTDNDGSVDVTFTWLVSSDLPNTDDSSVYLRIVPNDGNADGATVTSSAFAIDTAQPTAPGALTVNTTSTTSVVLNYGATSTDSNFSDYRIYYASATTTVTVSDTSFTSTSDSNLASSTYGGASTTTLSSLATSTQYTVNIWAYDTYGNRSSSASSVTFYTLATPAGAPTVTQNTATSHTIEIDTASNGAGAVYAIYNATDETYVAADGSATSTGVYQASSTWGATVTATGLTPSTQYCFSIYTRNGDAVQAAASDQTCTYTPAAVPVSGAASALSSSQIRVSWGANGNPNGTAYNVEDTTRGKNSGWITDRNYTFGELAPGTAYSYRIKARNTNRLETAYLGGISTSTLEAGPVVIVVPANPAPSNIPSAESAEPNADADAEAEAEADTEADAEAEPEAEANAEPKPVEISVEKTVENKPIPNTGHSIGQIISATPQRATITVRSEPLTVTLDKDKEEGLDTDRDGVVDMKAVYLGLDTNGNPRFKFTDLVNTSESGSAITINDGLHTIDTPNVTLHLNVDDVELMAFSNTEDFSDVPYVPYASTYAWKLSEEEGEKTVYAKFRSEKGGLFETFDTIIYATGDVQEPEPVVIDDTAEATPTCPLTPGRVYKSVGSGAVYQVFEKGIANEVVTPCTKKYFANAQIFFTHYSSWDIVKVVTQERLAQVPNDDVPFMSLGPKYDLGSGSLVKATQDPRVFLVVENTRRWIVSEAVFSALEYTWGWIEDVSDDLLDLYEEGDPIRDGEGRPAGTVIMYAEKPDLYLLEASPADPTMLQKRYIPDVETLTFLGYRLDRIAVIDASEEYETGEPITLAE